MFCFVIPSKNPDLKLYGLIEKLRAKSDSPIFVVNDGSTSGLDIFEQVKDNFAEVFVLRHAVNLGKGAALKTAFNRILCDRTDIKGCVTLDSDGQHSVKDALRIIEELEEGKEFVIGCREFSKNIPLKSYIGNTISKKIYRFILGRNIKDTQTGLRGLSKAFMKKCLSIKSNKFEFETEQFIIAVENNIEINEINIDTIYMDNNSGSNFNPLVDSLLIYFILLRYVLASFITFLLDFSVFSIFNILGVNIIASNLLARSVSILFQYNVSKTLVFKSKSGSYSFLLFIIYVYLSGIVSAILQKELLIFTGCSVYLSKLIIEAIMFLVGFSFVRTVVFTRNRN